jgi:hypothetical protein
VGAVTRDVTLICEGGGLAVKVLRNAIDIYVARISHCEFKERKRVRNDSLGS